MNNAYKLILVNDSIKTASVTFEPFGKTYTFLTIIQDLKEGDEVVVEVGNSDSLKVATVVKVHDEPDINPTSHIQYKWILSTAGTQARKEQARLQELSKQAITILDRAEKAQRRKRIAEQLKEVYGDSINDIKSIDFQNGDPLGLSETEESKR